MPKHFFFSVHEADVKIALEYFSANRILDTKKEYMQIDVNDKWILKYYKALFTDIDVFAQNFSHPADMLDYYGRTIIPPKSVAKLQQRLISANSLIALKKLNRLVDYTISRDYYIVHLGI